MEAQIRLRIIDEVAIILRIVTSEERPKALAKSTVDIAHFVEWFGLSKHQYIRFDILAFEGSRLPHKSLDRAGMVLCQHRRYGVPFGGEVE